jgi:hypothetical protein
MSCLYVYLKLIHVGLDMAWTGIVYPWCPSFGRQKARATPGRSLLINTGQDDKI